MKIVMHHLYRHNWIMTHHRPVEGLTKHRRRFHAFAIRGKPFGPGQFERPIRKRLIEEHLRMRGIQFADVGEIYKVDAHRPRRIWPAVERSGLCELDTSYRRQKSLTNCSEGILIFLKCATRGREAIGASRCGNASNHHE